MPTFARLVVLIAVLHIQGAAAESFAHRIAFPSLDRDATGAPIAIPALYLRPDDVASDRPIPVVIALHGCNGLWSRRAGHQHELLASMQARVRALHAEGYAVVLPDSFNPRGRSEVCTVKIGNPTITPATRRLDALGALAFVAAQPGVDRERIVLMGWSHGGSTTLAAINGEDREVAQFRAAADASPFFRAAVAFYPGCAASLRAGSRFRPVTPVRVHIGALDDWTPATPCADLHACMQARGADFVVTVYPDSHHGFDAPFGGVILLEDVPNGVHPGAGVHVGPNPHARAAANASVRAFLREQLQ
jgi:dienelactone hydrolase